MTEPAAPTPRPTRNRSLRNLPPLKAPIPELEETEAPRLQWLSLGLAVVALVAGLAGVGLSLLSNAEAPPTPIPVTVAEDFSPAQETLVRELVAAAVSTESSRFAALIPTQDTQAILPTVADDQPTATQADAEVTPVVTVSEAPSATPQPIAAISLAAEQNRLYLASLTPLVLDVALPDALEGTLTLSAEAGAQFLADDEIDCRDASTSTLTLDDASAVAALCAPQVSESDEVLITATLTDADDETLAVGELTLALLREDLSATLLQVQAVGDEDLACPLFAIDADGGPFDQVPFRLTVRGDAETPQRYALDLALADDALGVLWLGALDADTGACAGAPSETPLILASGTTRYGSYVVPRNQADAPLPTVTLTLPDETETELALNPIVTGVSGNVQLFDEADFLGASPILTMSRQDVVIVTARDRATGAVQGEALQGEERITVWVPLGPTQRPGQFRTIGDVTALPTDQ